MNSDLIEHKFGNYHIEVLAQSDDVRVSRLFSIAEGVATTRTLAVVMFTPRQDDPVATEDAAIKAGASIGRTFKQGGWAVQKKNLRIGSFPGKQLDSRLREIMGMAQPQELALHVYRLQITRNGTSLTYADIVEVHHPGYLTEDELETLYSGLQWADQNAPQTDRWHGVLGQGWQ